MIEYSFLIIDICTGNLILHLSWNAFSLSWSSSTWSLDLVLHCHHLCTTIYSPTKSLIYQSSHKVVSVKCTKLIGLYIQLLTSTKSWRKLMVCAFSQGKEISHYLSLFLCIYLDSDFIFLLTINFFPLISTFPIFMLRFEQMLIFLLCTYK